MLLMGSATVTSQSPTAAGNDIRSLLIFIPEAATTWVYK